MFTLDSIYGIPQGGKIDWANCKCPVIARLVDVQSPKTNLAAATTTEAPIVTPTPPPTPPPPMPSLPPLPPFRSSVEDLEGKIRDITNLNSGQGNLSQRHTIAALLTATWDSFSILFQAWACVNKTTY